MMTNLIITFRRTRLPPPNQWTTETLVTLRIKFVDVGHTDIFSDKPLSLKASKVLEDLKHVNAEFIFGSKDVVSQHGCLLA